MSQPFRILIADDHAHAREGIREIVEDHHDFEVVGEAKNGQALPSPSIFPNIRLKII